MSGLEYAGKSTFVSKFETIAHTRVHHVNQSLSIEYCSHKGLTIVAWDCGRHIERNRDNRWFIDDLLNKSPIAGIIFVVDSSDIYKIDGASGQFVNCKSELQALVSNPRVKMRTDMEVLVIANKSDIEERLSIDDIKQRMNIDALARCTKRRIQVVSACLTTGTGMHYISSWIQKRVKRTLKYSYF